MKIERVISWFDKRNEDLIGEFNVDFISIDILKGIFNPPVEDPLLYNPYDINIEEVNSLKEYINIDFEFDKYTYQIDCFQVENDKGFINVII